MTHGSNRSQPGRCPAHDARGARAAGADAIDPSPGLRRFLLASAAIHVAAVVGLGLALDRPWKPKLEITWLDLDNRLGAPVTLQAARPAPEPRPPAEPRDKEPPPPERRGSRAAAAPAAPPAPPRKRSHRSTDEPFGPRRVALTHIAPGDAALMLLVRMDRVRRSAYGDAVRQLLAVFYDYRTLLWSPEIDPVRDFDALLIATPNPYRVTETFLAIRHRMPDRRLRAAIEHSVQVGRQRMRWRRSAPGLRGAIPSPPKLPHDPRSVILRRGLALLARPEHELLLTAPVPGRGADDRASAGNHAAARPGQSPGTLLDALREMEFEGGGADLRDTGPLRGRSRPALLLQAVNLPRLLRLPPDVPPPHNVQLTVPASEPARVEGVLSFDGSPTAARFVAAVNPRLERARRSLLLRLMGVARLLDRLRLRQVGAQVEAHVVLGGDEVRDLLALFRSAIPQVSVPGMPLRVAPDKGLPAGPTDAGLPDAGPTDAGLPDGARTATTDPAVDSSAVDLTPAAAPAADSPPATAPTADAGAATDAD